VVSGEYLGRPVLFPARVNGDRRGHERPGEIGPADVVLVEVVPLRARWLEDQFVLEQVGRFTIQGREEAHQSRIAGELVADGGNICDRVECFEQALPSLRFAPVLGRFRDCS
jgi:hypothetical protein